MEKRKVFKISIIDKEISRTEFDRNTFYTSDSELTLIFKLIEKDYSYDHGEILLYNEDDKSFVTRKITKKDNDFVYELDLDIIPHYGKWRAQLQLVNDGDVYTSKPFEFNIVNDLSNLSPQPTLTDINNWATLKQSANELIDEMKDIIIDFESVELERASKENLRQKDESERVIKENIRQRAESERISKENIRQKAELERGNNEKQRRIAEFERVDKENSRQQEETARKSTFEVNETERQNTFKTAEQERQTTFETNESERDETFNTNEATRQADELTRESAESVRVANEEERISKDSERDSKIDSKADVSELKLYAKKEQEAWIRPTLINGWGEYSDRKVQYRKDEFGIVRLSGLIRDGVIGTVAFILPAGYRPNTVLQYFNGGNGNMFRIHGGSGQVTVASGSNNPVSIDGITFPTF